MSVPDGILLRIKPRPLPLRSKQAGLPAPKEKAAARPANVVNLMDALRRSVESEGGKGKGAKPAKKAAADVPARAKRRAKG